MKRRGQKKELEQKKQKRWLKWLSTKDSLLGLAWHSEEPQVLCSGPTVNHLVTSSPPLQLLDGLREPHCPSTRQVLHHPTGHPAAGFWTYSRSSAPSSPVCDPRSRLPQVPVNPSSLVYKLWPNTTTVSTLGEAQEGQLTFRRPRACASWGSGQISICEPPIMLPGGHSPSTTHPPCCLARMKSVIPAQSPDLQPHFWNRKAFLPDASEGHTDLQLCVYEKSQAKRGTWPRSTALPNRRSLFEIHKIHPVTKVLFLCLFPAHGIILCGLHQNVIPFCLSPPLPGFCSD